MKTNVRIQLIRILALMVLVVSIVSLDMNAWGWSVNGKAYIGLVLFVFLSLGYQILISKTEGKSE